MKREFAAKIACLVFAATVWFAQNGLAASTVKEGSKVLIWYSLEADGEEFIAETQPKALEVAVGSKQNFEALEMGLVGLSVGDEKDIALKSAEAYGPMKEELLQEVPKKAFPPGAKLREGSYLTWTLDSGDAVRMRISKIDDETVYIDQNHPLAGKDLVFHVVIRNIGERSAEEAPA